MHRFRKKSDAKRAQLPENLLIDHLSPQSNTEEDSTLQLPPVSDFRTSLILPSLSRRFTLLRNSNGDPVSLDDIRSRFAEQRSKGDEVQITEEEEDLIVQALSDIQASRMAQTVSPTAPGTAVSPSSSDDAVPAEGENSTHLTNKTTSESANLVRSGISPSVSSPIPSSYLTSSGISRPQHRNSNKRYSNNLFGSSRFQDTSYLQNVSKTSVESRSTASLTGSDSQGGSVRSTRSLKDAENNIVFPPPNTDISGEVLNGLPEKGRLQSAISPSAAQLQNSLRMASEFTPQQMGRTTLALQQVIRSMEEEAEETIVVPRSRPPTGQSTKPSELPSAGTPTSWIEKRPVDDRDLEDAPSPQGHVSSTSAMAQFSSEAIAYSPTPSPAPYNRQDITSPTPRMPGYIPGMTRPLTPRAIDSDREGESNGHSSTPRARSPAYPSVPQLPSYIGSFSSRHQYQPSSTSSIEIPIQSILPPSILRTTTARGPSPGIPLRTTSPAPSRSRGNSTANAQIPSPLPSPGPDDRFKSDFMMRRPLSPFTPTATVGYSGSRPTTPSAGLWRPNSPYSQRGPGISSRETSSPGPELGRHSRNGSLVSSESFSDPSQRSHSNVYAPFSSWVQQTSSTNDSHPDTSITSIGLGQPLDASRSTTANRLAHRVPTPVNSRVRPAERSTNPVDVGGGQDPILLNRPVNKKLPKRTNTTTPPPQNHVQTQTQLAAPVASHTPSTSSSSSNVNLNIYGSASPMFSPLLNTSATSLLSVGSSYHSWADDNGKKTGWDQLVEYDSQRSPWQEIVNSHDQHGSETDDASDVEPLESPEEILRRTAGLSKNDLIILHKRLVEDAMNRRTFDPPRSPIRRRRMSNSRASFSAAQARENGACSPAPPMRQPTPVANPSTPSIPESTSRANALLDSVLHSIQNQNQIQAQPQLSSQPPTQLQSHDIPTSSASIQPQVDSLVHSPTTPTVIPQGVSALTNLLTPMLSNTSSTITTTSDAPTAEPHSTTDDDSSSRLPSISSGRESREDDASARYKALVDAIAVHEETAKTESPNPLEISPVSPTSPPPQSHEDDSGEATEVPPSRSWRSPQPVATPSNRVQLVREVSRRTAEATAALKNQSQFTDSDGTVRRKPKSPINVQQISNPHLISSSLSSTASLEVMPSVSSPIQPSPVASPVDRPANKLTDRFRKFRGSLRSRPHQLDTTTSSAPSPTNSLHSSIPGNRPLVTVKSPRTAAPTSQNSIPPTTVGRSASIKATSNATAVPKKSILDIFRKPKKDTAKESPRSPLPENPSYPKLPAVSRKASQVRPTYTVTSPTNRPRPSGEIERDVVMPIRHSEDYPLVEDSRAASPHDPSTVNQFISAASKLGIDPEVVNEVLARSGSMSSKYPPRTHTVMLNYAPNTPVDTFAPQQSRSDTVERSKTPDPPLRPTTLRPNPVNRYPEGEVVRRTLIFANDNISASDLNNMIRKDSIPGRQLRSASATSFHSTGSAAPREPPVPRLPANMPTNIPRTHASKPSESSSFFEAPSQDGYASNVDASSSIPFGSVTQPEENGNGPALEVLELSNGQLVWSVLSSLRAEDEDDQSFFRRSMASSRGQDGNDDMEIRVKEHKRWDSKGSNVSQGSYNNNNNHSRRRVPAASSARPETKVFRTNASTIGRLIDDLSKNMDSGSINFQRAVATPPMAQSNATSFHSESSGRQVERDIDALLNALGPRQGP